MEANKVVKAVMPNFERELSDVEERTVNNVLGILKANDVKEEVVRGRVLAKHKAFVRDLFNTAAEQGMFGVVADTTEIEQQSQ